MRKSYHIYTLGPIDYWEGWQGLDELSERLKLEEKSSREPLNHHANNLHEEWQTVVELIRKHTRWEGDGYWRVSSLPNPEWSCSEFLFSVKQLNNGSVFIASPFPLPWLQEYQDFPSPRR